MSITVSVIPYEFLRVSLYLYPYHLYLCLFPTGSLFLKDPNWDGRSGWNLRFCISKKYPDDADTPRKWTTFWEPKIRLSLSPFFGLRFFLSLVSQWAPSKSLLNILNDVFLPGERFSKRKFKEMVISSDFENCNFNFNEVQTWPKLREKRTENQKNDKF